MGVDDAGRGALAGPLVVCALTHPDANALLRMGARDSKTTCAAERAAFAAVFAADGRGSWAVATAQSAWIDQVGHATASNIAIRSAVDDLRRKAQPVGVPATILIDGLAVVPNLPADCTARYIANGDVYEPLIAAASLVAGHVYDLAMLELHRQFPAYDFNSHHGYSTEVHRQALYELGPTSFHRQRPTRSAMETHTRKTGRAMPAWAEVPFRVR